ncbi:MAG: divalent-cation tolerance protein CutA [Acidobacteria bacterium]|nr:divalent-cation tolerance protein CutA [Acidobacteriota bacterium]
MGGSDKEAIIVLTTVADPEEGRRLARVIVESRLAACVQILPPVLSVYRWESRLEESSESLLVIKTLQSLYAELEMTIRAAHSYQIPQILALPIVAGLPDYLDWLANSVCLSDRAQISRD